jgi:uncharacterized protein (TIGR02246 family)
MTRRPAALTTPLDDEDVAALAGLLADLENGFNQKAAAVLDRPFTADAVVVVPDGSVIRGWDDLFAYHTARLATAVAAWTTRVVMLSASSPGPDTALVHFRQETTTPSGGFANHGTVLAVRREGSWWIGALHNTNVDDARAGATTSATPSNGS